jgi:hypothetical protein
LRWQIEDVFWITTCIYSARQRIVLTEPSSRRLRALRWTVIAGQYLIDSGGFAFNNKRKRATGRRMRRHSDELDSKDFIKSTLHHPIVTPPMHIPPTTQQTSPQHPR